MIINKDLRHVEFGTIRITHDETENDVGYSSNGPLLKVKTSLLTFDPTAIEGLEDIPSFRRDKTSRPLSHGSFLENGFSDPRIITLTGHAIAMNPQLLHSLRSSLAQHLNTGEFRQFKFDFSGGTRYVTGSCDSGLSWTQELDHYAKWKFDIYCPDPRLYSRWNTQRMSSGDTYREGLEYSLSYPLEYSRDLPEPKTPKLTNRGNSPAYPVFEMDANTGGFFIKNGAGKGITYSASTYKGQKVVIDTFTGNATVGGSDRSYNLTKRDWFTIPPGGTLAPELDIVASPDVEASLFMEVKYRDTWI